MLDRQMAEVFPLFLKLSGRVVLVVGGGEVAERKVASLLEAGARVRLVTLAATSELEAAAERGALTLERRAFDPRDVDEAWLVVACTDDPAAQRGVGAACEARRVFCLAVDDLANATAYGGSVVERPPFVIAISSSGHAPALTRLLRAVIEHVLPPDSFVRRARALRAEWKRDGVPMEERFGRLVRAALADQVGILK